MDDYKSMAKVIEDMDILINDSDKSLISRIIDEVINREDLFITKREAFLKNLPAFRERYDV